MTMLKSRTTEVQAPEEPTLASVAPEWVKLSGLLQELVAREQELVAQITEKMKVINGSGLTRFNETNIGPIAAARAAEDKPPRMIGPSKKVAEILGEFTPAPRPAPEPLSHEPKISREMRELGEEAAAVKEAIALLRPQLARAHQEGSARLCELLAPRYKQIARRICAALVELGSADIEQREFLQRHRNAARARLRVLHSTGSLGDPREPSSELRRLLDWAAECGHFDLADLPAEWGPQRSARGSVRSFPLAN